MEYDFLKNFPRRMKNVGLYALLFENSSKKLRWKDYGYTDVDEQLNLIFAVMLFVMEQSLREENCTIDDISNFIDKINRKHFHKPELITTDSGEEKETCRLLGDFIINDILSNGGAPMYFNGYDFEHQTLQQCHINYVSNSVVYTENDVRRTSYKLTDDGYYFLLGTLEVENDILLLVKKLVFKMHLARRSYDKALEDVKNIFGLIRMQVQKTQDAMSTIRQNALKYSVAEYERLLNENLDTISATRDKFDEYKSMVATRISELEKAKIDLQTLTEDEDTKLHYLQKIGTYLDRTIDEHQKIFKEHYKLKNLYKDELRKLGTLRAVQRFNLRSEIFDKILEDPSQLFSLDDILHMAFNKNPARILNLERVYEPQKVRTDEEINAPTKEIVIDVAEWEAEQDRLIKEKLQKYKDSLLFILNKVMEQGSVRLSDIRNGLQNESDWNQLIPNVNIFKEIMVKLLRTTVIDISELKKQRKQFIQEATGHFYLNSMILEIMDEHPDWQKTKTLTVQYLSTAEPVLFPNVQDQDGQMKNIRCTDVLITATKGVL